MFKSSQKTSPSTTLWHRTTPLRLERIFQTIEWNRAYESTLTKHLCIIQSADYAQLVARPT